MPISAAAAVVLILTLSSSSFASPFFPNSPPKMDNFPETGRIFYNTSTGALNVTTLAWLAGAMLFVGVNTAFAMMYLDKDKYKGQESYSSGEDKKDDGGSSRGFWYTTIHTHGEILFSGA